MKKKAEMKNCTSKKYTGIAFLSFMAGFILALLLKR